MRVYHLEHEVWVVALRVVCYKVLVKQSPIEYCYNYFHHKGATKKEHSSVFNLKRSFFSSKSYPDQKKQSNYCESHTLHSEIEEASE